MKNPGSFPSGMGGIHLLPITSLHTLPALHCPAGQLQASLTQGVPREGSNRHHCTLPQACPSPEPRVLEAILGFPVSTATCKEPTPPARDPKLVPAQEQSKAGLFSDCQHKSSKDAWQQAQECSLGGCLRSLPSSMSCNALRGPRQASSIPPCHWPSFPAKHYPTAGSCNALQSHKHLFLGGSPEMRCHPSPSGEPEQYQGAGSKGTGTQRSGLRAGRARSGLGPRATGHSQPTAGRGSGGSCTAPPWPSPEVQVAPKRLGASGCQVLQPAEPKRRSTGVFRETFTPCQASADCLTVIHSLTSVLPHCPQTFHSSAQSRTCATFHGAVPQAESLGS